MSTRPTDMAPTNWNVIPSIFTPPPPPPPPLHPPPPLLPLPLQNKRRKPSSSSSYQFQMECFHQLLMLIEVDEGEVRPSNKYPRWRRRRNESSTQKVKVELLFFSPVNIEASFVTVWLVCRTRQEVRVSPVCRLTVAIFLPFGNIMKEKKRL